MYCYVSEEYFETSHTLKQILKKNQFINISLRFYKYDLLLEKVFQTVSHTRLM